MIFTHQSYPLICVHAAWLHSPSMQEREFQYSFLGNQVAASRP